MAEVTYDKRSFMIDGRRVWLVSGAVHYFRMPAALWCDRLLKAQRGGLNCIETYIPWNFHEPAEGKYDFSGDRNVVEFIQQAGDLGMYVIVRPGPYICAEWNFGGLPGWLATKPGIQYRSNNAAFTHYYDRWFRQLLPRLAPLQVSQGGNIIAVQNENEYIMTTQPDRLEYLDFISQQYRRAGLDIPILSCNWLSEPRVRDAIECVNGWDNVLGDLRRLRRAQPNTPLLVTELWCGKFDRWGGAHGRREPRETARRALEVMGAGAQVNYYMYHGGTNFGFWAGRVADGDAGFITTSYDYDAPIAEGGGLSRKYYLLRLVNMMACHMGEVLAAAVPVAAAASRRSTATYYCTGPKGGMTVVTNNGDEGVAQTTVMLADGRELTVDLSHFGAVAVFHDVKLTEQHRLDYSNLMPLGLFAGPVLVLHGAAGQAAVVSVNGHEHQLAVPDGEAPLSLDCEGLTVLVVPSAVAERCWLVDGKLIVAPAFVGETEDDVVPPPHANQYLTLEANGRLQSRRIRKAAAASPRTPTLGAWKSVARCTEPNDVAELVRGFHRLERPRSLARLDAPQGYGWYRLTLETTRAASKNIFLPDCDDRAAIFVNGRRVGVWGRGQGAKRTPIRVPLRKGANQLTFLADDLGRFNHTARLGESKGIWGDVYTAVAVRPQPWRLRPGEAKDFSRRIVPRAQQHLVPALRSAALVVCEATFKLTRALPVHLQFAGLAASVAVFLNDRQVGFFAAGEGGFGDALCAREARAGANQIRLLMWGEVTGRDLARAFALYRLEENLSAAAKWRFKPWAPPTELTAPPRAGQGPAWFAARFKASPAGQPLFLALPCPKTQTRAQKGQIYLNGHNVGRFWSIGPQEAYYLPECWLQEVNSLLVFAESGAPPVGAKLQYMPLGPYRTK